MKGTFRRRYVAAAAPLVALLIMPATALGGPAELPSASVVTSASAESWSFFATTETDVIKDEPFTWEGPNPCTEEWVSVTGHMHHNMHLTLEDDGGMHMTDRVDTQGTGASVALDPKRYVVDDTNFLSINLPGPPPAEDTVIQYTRIIRQGDSFPTPDDFSLRWQFHFTVDANGVPTAQVDGGPTAECK
jgi:hypothetical protein